MSEHEQVDIEFDVADKATPKLHKMAHGADKLGHAVDHATHRFMELAEVASGIGGAMLFGEAVHHADEFVERIERIHNLTGLAADRAAGLSEALQTSGVQGDMVEAVLAKIVKRGAVAEEGGEAMAKMAQRYGINLKEGPEKALMSMSKLIQDHKVEGGQVGRVFGLTGKNLSTMMKALEKGPEELGTMIDEATEKNKFMAGSTLDQMQSYHEAVNRVGLAWHRLTAGIYVRLAPALEKVASKFEDAIEGWMGGAQRFGTFLVDHMHQIISMAKVYSKIMMANFVLGKLGGGSLIGKARGFVSGGSALGLAKGGFGSIISVVTGLFTGASKLGPIIGGLGRLSVIGAGIMLVIGVFKAMVHSSAGQAIIATLGRIWSGLMGIGEELGKLFGPDTAIGQFFRTIGDGFLKVINFILGGLESLITLARVFMVWLRHPLTTSMSDAYTTMRMEGDTEAKEKSGYGKIITSRAYRHMLGNKGEATDEDKRTYQAYVEAKNSYGRQIGEDMSNDLGINSMKGRFGGPIAAHPEKGDVNMDFRGSKFDIKQEFSEGFDPDRIAVTFANDVAAIGERRLQSGFSPLFTVR